MGFGCVFRGKNDGGVGAGKYFNRFGLCFF